MANFFPLQLNPAYKKTIEGLNILTRQHEEAIQKSSNGTPQEKAKAEITRCYLSSIGVPQSKDELKKIQQMFKKTEDEYINSIKQSLNMYK